MGDGCIGVCGKYLLCCGVVRDWRGGGCRNCNQGYIVQSSLYIEREYED